MPTLMSSRLLVDLPLVITCCRYEPLKLKRLYLFVLYWFWRAQTYLAPLKRACVVG
jgi:hypothetical protein